MSKELYVGSLSYDTTEWELEKLFSVSGRVTSIHLITDPKTGQFKGCGYVRMSTEAEAKDAIASLDGALFLERTITVSIANPQKQAQQGGYKGKAGGAPRGARAAGVSGGRAAGPVGGRAAGGSTGSRSAGGSAGGRSAGGSAGGRAAGAPAGSAAAAKPATPKKAFSKPSSPKPAASKPAASKKRP